MTSCPWPIEDLVPHARPMLLLDTILACDADGAQALVTIQPDSPFAGPQGVPAHVGIEYMAQTCGAWAGGEARRVGKPPQLGYLLGTRRYHAAQAFFPVGTRILVEVTLSFRDGPMGVFDCRMEDFAGGLLAEARLNLYQPEEGENLP